MNELVNELLAYLNQFSVAFRYPGESANKLQAKKAIEALKILKPVLIEKMRFSDK